MGRNRSFRRHIARARRRGRALHRIVGSTVGMSLALVAPSAWAPDPAPGPGAEGRQGRRRPPGHRRPWPRADPHRRRHVLPVGQRLYRLIGSEPPPPAERPALTTARGRGERPAEQRRSAGLDAPWARAERQVPGWVAISLRVPARSDGPIVFVTQEPVRWHPAPRSQLTLDPITAEIALGAVHRPEPGAAPESLGATAPHERGWRARGPAPLRLPRAPPSSPGRGSPWPGAASAAGGAGWVPQAPSPTRSRAVKKCQQTDTARHLGLGASAFRPFTSAS